MKRDIESDQIEREMVRALQAMYPESHQALTNWGKWIADCRGIKPAGIVSPGYWQDAPTSKWEHDETDTGPMFRVELGPIEKGDRPEEEPYNQGKAETLHDRMFLHGGLPEYLKSVVEVSYGPRHRNMEEDQFHAYCVPSCLPETFRQRLEDVLIFVGRFV